MIKSNPIPTKQVSHKLENNNNKEVLPVLRRLVLNLSGFPAWGYNLTKGLEITMESDLEGQWDFIIGIPQDWVKQRLQYWWAQTKRERAVAPLETEPKLSASVGRSPVEVWAGRGLAQGWGHWQQQS